MLCIQDRRRCDPRPEAQVQAAGGQRGELAVGAVTAVGIALLLPVGGAVVAVGLLLAGVVAPAVTVWAARRTERRTSAMRGDVLSRTVELLEAAPDLLAFNAADRYREYLDDADRRLSTLLRRAAVARGLGSGVGVLAIGAMSVAATAAGIVAVRAGLLPGPTLAVVALTPLALADVVAGLPDAAVRLLTALAGARRLAELETQPSPVTEPACPATADPPAALATRHLAVRWPETDRDAVHDLDMTLLAGTRLAITGPSGSGKSSLVAALMRILDPSAGTVLADGRDVRDLACDTVRRGIAWCGAAAHLFDNTLRANLALASPAATDEALAAALERAQLGGWLATLPAGLDTPIGEHGKAVSGGERQRIGVARALLADRPITILDEPTAHLDPHTADALAAELLHLTRGQTALIVTHRPEQTPGLPQLHLRHSAPTTLRRQAHPIH
jgi:ATP-binding cassette subfamily C protein CydCD